MNREDILKRAEKLLRQGKLDGAIEEYVRLIEEQPRDWNSINVLGDLYLRAGNTDRAVEQFTRVADHLFVEGFLPKAAALYKKALKVQGQHEHALSHLAKTAVRQKLVLDAKTYLRQLEQVRRLRSDERGAAECVDRIRALEDVDAEDTPPASRGSTPEPVSIGEDAGRLLALAEQELAAGNDMKARTILTRVLTLEPARHAEVMRVALQLARDGRIDSAFGCIDVLTDAALLGGELHHAVEALQTFVRDVPHIPALIKLVEVSVDGGLDAPLRAAQAQLADAYLAAGKGAEARVIAEDLLEHDPESAAHAERRRRAFGLLGITDAEKAPLLPETMEIDLSDVLQAIGGSPPAGQPSHADPYTRAREYLQAGRTDEAIVELEAAALVPRTRAMAAAELGRLYIRRGDLQAGVEWLERAADGPAATPDEASAVLYDLADALERLGEQARALAILIDLDADSGGYRDVRTRIELLSRAQAGSHGG